MFQVNHNNQRDLPLIWTLYITEQYYVCSRFHIQTVTACRGVLNLARTISPVSTTASTNGTMDARCDKVCNPDKYPHKALMPMDSSDWWTLSFAALGILLAAGGGIGGGGILVPLYVLVGQFAPKEAVPLSNITILGGAIANVGFNFWKRHPFADRPRIDFDIVNVMEPMTIAGAVLGSLINKLLPGWLLTILLMLILFALTVRTARSGLSKWASESKKLAEADEEQSGLMGHRTAVPMGVHYGSTTPVNQRVESGRVRVGVVETTSFTPQAQDNRDDEAVISTVFPHSLSFV